MATPPDDPPASGRPPESARHPRLVWLRRASWGVMGIAVLLLGYVVSLILAQNYQQGRLEQAWERSHPPVTLVSVPGPPVHHAHLADGQAMARLLIPRIGFDAIVAEGADRGILSGGPGHEDHTAYPGEGGMVLISNHNGFSLSWGDIRIGDTVSVEMPYGTFRYVIQKRTIVSGGDTTVMGHVYKGETLLLSTCWPLWAGPLATDRLVFEAKPA